MGEITDRFPLFLLPLVLLPSEVVPLHVFEDRYKLMIGECLESDSEFGIVWLADDGLREIGCTARVPQVLAELEDGRLNILVAGGRAFRLLRRIDDMAYPAGEVEMLDDSPDPGGAALAEVARERYADLVEQATDERPAADDLAELDAYGMAATIEFDPPPKQELLELRSEGEGIDPTGDLFGAT